MENQLVEFIIQDEKKTGLQLSPIIVNQDYRKKWNIFCDDFVVLTMDGNLITNTLYRVGGMNYPNLAKDEYFMLIKHVEAFYPDDILKACKSTDPRHLEDRWCILNKHGIEKVVFPKFKHPYLLKDSVIYSIDGKYYNIETGELYCDSSTSMKSEEFLFLENRFDQDKSKRGVMKIHKKHGTWELFR